MESAELQKLLSFHGQVDANLVAMFT